MRNQLLLLLLLSAGIHCGAQDVQTVYFDQHLQLVSDTLAPIMGAARRQGADWQVLLVDASTGRKFLSGYFDSTWKQKVGPFTFYYANGQKEAEGYYHNNRQTGFWRNWDENGHLTDSVRYSEDEPQETYSYQYDEAGRLKSFAFGDSKQNHHNIEYFPSGRIRMETTASGKARIMHTYDEQGVVLYEFERDAKGKVLTDRSIGTAAQAATEKNRFSASFPGGRDAMLEYFRHALFPNGSTTSFELVVSFKIDAKGSAFDINTSYYPDKELARRVETAVRRMPPWGTDGKSVTPVSLNVTFAP